jgi:oligopeptide/dipeptide ABC transporter ATP-binding protein
MSETVLRVENLSVRYRTRETRVHAVDSVSFELQRGKVLALVGESGSGKSTAAMAVLKLLPGEAGILSGRVLFGGMDLLSLQEKDLRTIRGRRIATIFQDPVAGLNPVISVGDQVAETLTSHLSLDKKEAKRRAVQILHNVGLSDPDRVAKSFPFQLSGGMCQRVMIGIATALDPEILIADEPTSALDVTVQAQILHQLDELRRNRGTSIILITHAFGVVANIADHVAVMYGGRVIEQGDVDEMLSRPLHPYTHALLGTLPRLDSTDRVLQAIPGGPPDLAEPAEHCAFIPRCPKVMNQCRLGGPPALELVAHATHPVACYNPIWQSDSG